VLQIISGKFFNSEERFISEGKGILFSNYSWVQPIKTCVATLEPVDFFSSVASYVVSYTNQIEKVKPPEKDVLVRVGDSEIVDQFMVICSFFLRAYFHRDRNTVAVACRDKPLSSSDYCIPSQFVPRFFSNQIRGTVEETEALSNFIESVIGLKRKYYNTIITSLHSFVDAMQIIGTNIDLAYSLLIYSLEALSQRSDLKAPTWEDYPSQPRDDIDGCLRPLEDDTASRIRTTLLKHSNLKATKRFLDFVKSHIEDEFFISEAPAGMMTVRKNELDKALRNAYEIRSKFVHLLQPIQEQLKHPTTATSDLVRYLDEPYLSISGIVRIAQHVIKNFIERSEKVTNEAFNWRKELPGILQMEMAPQYWIWKHEGFKPEHATIKLSGYLSQLESAIISSAAITDIRELLEKYEKLIDQTADQFKLQMLATYILYNWFIDEKHKCKNYSTIFDKYKVLFDVCTIETMITWLLMGQSWPWSLEDCEETWKKYQKKMYRKTSIKIPPMINVAMLVEIASLCFSANSLSDYKKWMGMAILNAAGQKDLQKRLIDAKSLKLKIRGMEVLYPPSSGVQE